MNKQFCLLVKEYIRETFALFPSFASYMGEHRFDSKLESYSADARQETLSTLRRFQRERSKFSLKELSLEEAIDFDLMGVELFSYQTSLEEIKSWETDPNVYLETAIYSIYFLIERGTLPIETRAQAILARLNQFPRLFFEARMNLKKSPRLFTETAIEVAQGALIFFKGLKFKTLRIRESLKRELLNANKQALVELNDFLNWLKKELILHSNGNYAVGEELFNGLLKHQHLLPYSSKELKEIAWKNYDKILRELKTVGNKIDRNKSWKEILLENSHNHPGRTELISTYRSCVSKIKKFLKNKRLVPFPASESMRVGETPEFNRMFLPFAAYMPSPAFESHGRGEFWVTPIPAALSKKEAELRLREHAYFRIPITAVHEAYPGHHLHFSFANENRSNLAKRSSSSVSCEGWAFYCEEMMKEEGFYKDPLTELCQLQGEFWRICRVILDVDLHTKRISSQKGVEFLMKNISFPKAMAFGEIKRYVREATQPMSYFMGKWEIMKLREAYRKKKGSNFQIRDFHEKFLHCGIIPVSLAKKKMLL